jgi:hypothetical protein
MNVLYYFCILSIRTSLQDLYEQIENHVIQKIDHKEYTILKLGNRYKCHTMLINIESVIINSKKKPIYLNYTSYLQNGREEDFLVDILFSLYAKKTKCINKILIIKIKNSPNPEKISSIFKNISPKYIQMMIERYGILNFDPTFLIYKDVIVNSLVYDCVVYKMNYGYLNINTSYNFAFKVKGCRYFFKISISDLHLEPYIREILSMEYFFLRTKFYFMKMRAKKIQLEVLLRILIDNVNHLNNDSMYSGLYSLHVLQHSLLVNKPTEVLFYYQESLNNFFHNLADVTPCNRTFYIYEYKSILGINKCIYSYDPANKEAFIISSYVYNKIRNYFIILQKHSCLNSKFLQYNFYIFANTQFFEYILRRCFSKRFSAEFIVIVHNLKFAGLIDHKEFINLMTFVSDQVWFIKIYNHMVDIIIKRILNTPISDLLSAKCLYFQYFIMIQLKTLINEKDVSDSANKITKSMQKDYLAGKDLIDAMQDAYVASIQVKLVIKLIIFTFSKNIGGNRMLEFIHFLYEDGRPRQNIFDSNDYTKVKRHLVNSLRREGNSGSLVGYRRYFKRFYRCQA